MRSVDRQSIRFNSLQISILAAVAMFSSACFDSKFTKCDKTGLSCPPGYVCSADEDSCIRAGSCGNGVVSDGETCDDGNNQSRDGCSADCTSNESCGNDILDVAVGEICDDGNRIDGDGCSADCESESCGNRTVDVGAGEECDTGPGDSFGSDVDCTFVRCGDGYRNTVAEDCEVMDSEPTALCDGDCSFPKCGDKYINPNFPVYTPPPGEGPEQMEECDAGMNTESCNGNDNDSSTTAKGKGNCQEPACGDGYKNPKFKLAGAAEPEECDAGADSDMCNGNGPGDINAKCQPPRCGDSYKNPQFRPSGMSGPTEACDAGGDTGTAPNGDPGCNGNGPGNPAATCQIPRCGDGYKNPQFRPSGPLGPVEAGDAGGDTGTAPNGDPGCNGNGPGNAAARCQRPTCGDGYRNAAFTPGPPPNQGGEGAPEGCDRGGNMPADANGPACNGNDNLDGKGNCQVSMCGDGYLNRAAGEECDTGTSEPDEPCGVNERCFSCECVDPE